MSRLLKENFPYSYLTGLALIIMIVLVASCKQKAVGQDEKPLYECHAHVQCLYDAKKQSASSQGTNEISECKKIKSSLLAWSRTGHNGHSFSHSACKCEIIGTQSLKD